MAMELVLNGGPMKNTPLHIRSVFVSIFLIAQLIVGIQPAQAEVVLPKGSWLNCASASSTYCIDSVSVIPTTGKELALTWTTTGSSADATANPAITSGKALPGRWSNSSWASLGLGAKGYDGIYIDAKAANEFVPWVYVDAQPTLSASGSVRLAAQTSNINYPTDLDQAVTISIKLRFGNFQTGVTFGVGTDVSVETTVASGVTSMVIEGNPVMVPLAKSSKDCVGNTGVAGSLIRQFQTVIIPQNDPLGFTVAGSTGNLYVGSNGLCKLSTPIWNADTKRFRYTASAPRLAPDGTTVNKGFYRAIIPISDAKLFWGLTNPNDAAKALVVSIITAEAGSKVALSSISVNKTNIVIDVSNFDFPDPALDIALNPSYTMNSAATEANQNSSGPAATGSSKTGANNQKITATKGKTTTITCVKGKTTRKVTAVKPVCPKGFTKK
ncbi:MAG: hypothetical protein RI899_270 [Actinomycetota bacterium]|jgi:hypothetical protein